MDEPKKRRPNKAKQSGFKRGIKSTAGMKGATPELDGCMITAPGEMRFSRRNLMICKYALPKSAGFSRIFREAQTA